MQIKEPKEGLNLRKSFSEHGANHSGMDFCCCCCKARSWYLSRSQTKSSTASGAQDLHFHSGPMHDATLLQVPSLSSLVKQMSELFAVIKKTAGELGCKWQSELSSPQHTAALRAAGREVTQPGPGTAALQCKYQIGRKATLRPLHLCHKPTRGFSNSISFKNSSESPQQTQLSKSHTIFSAEQL